MLDFFFGQTIYKHHWLSMIISVSTCSILKIVTIILSFVDYNTNESDKNYKPILYVKIWYIVIIGIIMLFSSYINKIFNYFRYQMVY